MGKKIYCILKKGEYIYIPIKALFNPHVNKKNAYLAKLPNFFGGRCDESKDEIKEPAREENKKLTREEIDGLVREVTEESQDNIDGNIIKDSIMTPLYSTKIYNDEYKFFLADVTNNTSEKGDFFDSNRLLLKTCPKLDANCREMSCILKVPVERIRNKDRDTNTNTNTLLDICKEIGGQFVMKREELSGTSAKQWNEPGTKNAFEELCSII